MKREEKIDKVLEVLVALLFLAIAGVVCVLMLKGEFIRPTVWDTCANARGEMFTSDYCSGYSDWVMERGFEVQLCTWRTSSKSYYLSTVTCLDNMGLSIEDYEGNKK